MNIKEIAENNALVNKVVKVGKEKVVVKTFLSVDKFVEAVLVMANSCFVDGEYRPEYKPIAERYVVVNYLTDIEIDGVSAEEIFKITHGDWFNAVEGAIDSTAIYYEIRRAVDEAIDYRIKNAETGFDKLCKSISKFSETDNSDVIEEVKDILGKLGNVDKKDFVEALTEKKYPKDSEVNGKKS